MKFTIALIFCFLSVLSWADEHGRLSYRDLDEEGLKDHLSRLPNTPGYRCARGVRLILNVLFRGGPKTGKNALEYNEKVLSQWQTEDYRYKKVKNLWDFKNYDVKVLLPVETCPKEAVRKFGHIEFYYDGVWYSDFKQPASVFDSEEAWALRDPNYKRCYSAQVIYRLMPKK